MKHHSRLVCFRGFGLLVIAALVCLCSAGAGPAAAELSTDEDTAAQGHRAGQAIPAAASETPTMPVADVRIGMKGYGLTVFQGTQVEPFPVEVVSIAHNQGPKRSAIWIRSDDPRLLESGPVQGMSGSPIYLWDKGEAKEIGEGGRLIGAFAFGFANSKGCLAGVQPIAYMRAVGQRAADGDRDKPKKAQNNKPVRPGDVTAARRMIATLTQEVQRDGGGGGAADDRLKAWQALIGGENGAKPQADEGGSSVQVGAPQGKDSAAVQRLMLPMSVGSARVADVMRPFLEPMGIEAVASDAGLVAGPPPKSVQMDAAALKPGSVLSVPLAFGDLDLSASGTVTDVLPDGTVLGFGHAMFGEGTAALPMATGFVHFVVPRRNVSFKLGGSLKIRGSIVRDEVAAVAGRGSQRFATAPLTVTVDMPNQPAETYEYQVVDHRRLTPALAAMVTMQSIAARHAPPPESTLYLSGRMHFTGGHTINVDTMMPGEQMSAAMSELLPPIAAAMQNPHQTLTLESMHVTARVAPKRLTGSIVNARLEQAVVEPGETVGVNVWVQRYGQRTKQHRAEITIPSNLKDGDYPLVVSDAQSHLAQLVSSRPHLFTTRNVDDLMGMIQRIVSVKRNAIHLTMRLPEEGIAVGRQELPSLPSSRRAMILTPTSTVAQPFMQTLEQRINTDVAITGQVGFTVHVRSDRTRTQPPPGEDDG